METNDRQRIKAWSDTLWFEGIKQRQDEALIRWSEAFNDPNAEHWKSLARMQEAIKQLRASVEAFLQTRRQHRGGSGGTLRS